MCNYIAVVMAFKIKQKEIHIYPSYRHSNNNKLNAHIVVKKEKQKKSITFVVTIEHWLQKGFNVARIIYIIDILDFPYA